MHRTRRQFLAEVGQGMLIASVGSGLAADLGLAARADEAPRKLVFGDLEPLVCLMQETGPDKLLPLLVKHLQDGTDLRRLVAAAALANARTFGGEDYIGFHTMMALAPAYYMSRELPEERRPLPILKVLYRNSNQIQAKGGRKNEVLQPVDPSPLPEGRTGHDVLLDAMRRKDLKTGEQTLAGLVGKSPEDGFNELLHIVEDQLDVHRIVMPWRAWDLLPLVGKEHAQTMLRQSVHYCIQQERPNSIRYNDEPRALLPKLFDQHKLAGKQPGKRTAEDAWVEKLSETIFSLAPAQAAEAIAAALGEGFAPDVIGEAIALAANQLVLRDEGRAKSNGPQKPAGSVHGDGIGVHACDTINAFRNMARVSNARNTFACLILGAYHVARERTHGDFLKWQPYPRQEARESVKKYDADALLAVAERAIKERDQALACAAVQRYGEQEDFPARKVFDLLLKYAVSEDGALHAEKYYRTVSEEFAAARPAFRWRQLVALARVTASEYGYPAPGHADACRLLKI